MEYNTYTHIILIHFVYLFFCSMQYVICGYCFARLQTLLCLSPISGVLLQLGLMSCFVVVFPFATREDVHRTKG